jgi:hypothetical protein
MDDQTTEPKNFVSLGRRAFAEFGTQALWNERMLDEPKPEDALVVARPLRIEGDRKARELAEQIERVCRRAAHKHCPSRQNRRVHPRDALSGRFVQ